MILNKGSCPKKNTFFAEKLAILPQNYKETKEILIFKYLVILKVSFSR